MESVGENQLVASIYDATSGLCSWRATLDLIACRLDLWAVQLLAIAKTPGGCTFNHVGGSNPAQSALDYLYVNGALNPWVPHLLTLGPLAWLHGHDEGSGEFGERSSFASDFLTLYRCRQSAATKVWDNPETAVLVIALQRADQKPLVPASQRLFETTAFHLGRAMDIACRARAVALLGGSVHLSQFSQPMMMIDDQRVIQVRNDAAERALAAEDFARERGGKLSLVDPSADRQLQAAVRALTLESSQSTTRTPRRMVRAERLRTGVPMAASVTLVPPHHTPGGFGAMPLALLTFHDLSPEIDLDPQLVGELLRLTPAEARVAARLARGHRPDQIAVEVGVAIATVRSQIKSIFAKTGVARLTELASVVARLANCR